MKHSLLTIIFSLLPLVDVIAIDVCQTKYSKMHYADSECIELVLSVNDSSDEKFKLKANFITKDFNTSKEKNTIILIPGGPGESANPLRRAMQERDILNALWHGLDFNLVMYDPRGTGSSLLNKETNLLGTDSISTKLNVMDLAALIKKVSGNKKVILMAHSAGGSVALRYAHQNPDKVKKIVLISASVSPRDMALSNLSSYQKSIPEFFLRYINSLDLKMSVKSDLYDKLNYIEDVLAAQLKARLMSKHVNDNFTTHVLTRTFRTPKDFRDVLRTAIESNSNNDFVSRVNGIYKMITDLGSYEDFNPSGLQGLKFKNDSIASSDHDNKQWIQRLIMCGEGIKKSEIEKPLFYEGRTMKFFCGDYFTKKLGKYNSNLDWLKEIKAPTLVIGGDLDHQVFISKQKNIAEIIPFATFVVIDGARHTFFNTHPMGFYSPLERFLTEFF